MTKKTTIAVIVLGAAAFLSFVFWYYVCNKDRNLLLITQPTFSSQYGQEERDPNVVNYYTIRDNRVYFHDTEIVGADANTFVAIRLPAMGALVPSLAVDAHRVYEDERVIDISDPDTFRLINSFSRHSWIFAKDKMHVYLIDGSGPSIINGADPKTFHAIYADDTDGTFYAKDASGVFYAESIGPRGEGASIRRIEGADPDTFEAIGTMCYAKDKNYVYADGVPVKTADPTTFRTIVEEFVPEEIDGGPPYAPFASYAKDKNHVYTDCGKIISGANPNTFGYMGKGMAIDGITKYHFGERGQ